MFDGQRRSMDHNYTTSRSGHLNQTSPCLSGREGGCLKEAKTVLNKSALVKSNQGRKRSFSSADFYMHPLPTWASSVQTTLMELVVITSPNCMVPESVRGLHTKYLIHVYCKNLILLGLHCVYIVNQLESWG